MSRLKHRIFLGIKPKPKELKYWLFEDGKNVLFENNEKVLLEKQK